MLVENLIRRARIVACVRKFFDERGFVEVDTPVRISAPAPEPHIDCPPCVGKFLRASPELQMKKLLAYGMDKIYQMGPCFREGEIGSRHNPEFTMLEWYRKDASYLDIMEDMKSLISTVYSQASERYLKRQHLEFRVVGVRDEYRKLAGWDPWTEWNQDRFDFDMADKIEPNLSDEPTFLVDYPPETCSLARLRGNVAERWELYWKGIEIANCFTELCDSSEQRRRFIAAAEERRRIGECEYPLDDDFLNLLPLIGSASGVALGIDRLVMILSNAERISEVRSPE